MGPDLGMALSGRKRAPQIRKRWAGLPKEDLIALAEVVAATLGRDEWVALPGFGALHRARLPAREGRDRHGRLFSEPDRWVIRFAADWRPPKP